VAIEAAANPVNPPELTVAACNACQSRPLTIARFARRGPGKTRDERRETEKMRERHLACHFYDHHCKEKEYTGPNPTSASECLLINVNQLCPPILIRLTTPPIQVIPSFILSCTQNILNRMLSVKVPQSVWNFSDAEVYRGNSRWS
jgi:hypothetical protein